MLKLVFIFGIMAAVCHAELTKEERDVSVGNNLLGFNIYKELAKKPGNVLFSPASAETILALSYTGATGDTAKEMQSTLNLPDPVSTATGYKTLTQKWIKTKDGVTFKTANKIYPAINVNVKPDFMKIAQESFNSDVQNLDYSNTEAAANTINQWVESQTNNKIQNLIDKNQLSVTTHMVLVNAVYFLGKWPNKFGVAPKKLPFHTSPTKSVDAEYISSTQYVGYAVDNDLDAQIIDIPYNDTDYSLRIILPNQIDGLSKIESQLPLNLEAQTKKLSKLKVNLIMPKFKVETNMDLVAPLQKLGMKKAFENSAEFGGLTDTGVQLSRIIQKAFIEVDEHGTEAAAATGEEVELRIGRVTFRLNVIADRPFLFLLIERSANYIAFIGRVFELN